MIVCWSAKGGSGVTVVAAAIAVGKSSVKPTTLVDVCGDVAPMFAIADGPGVFEWMSSAVATPASLAALRIDVDDDLGVIPAGSVPTPMTTPTAAADWVRLAAALNDDVVVDAGVGRPPAALVERASASVLVIRPCYLALRRATALTAGQPPSGVIVVDEPGTALRPSDIANVVGAPVLARVSIDPAIPRVIAAGLAAHRFPQQIVRQLRGVW